MEKVSFTSRHGLGIAIGAALGILLLNILQAFGLLNIWTAILVSLSAIELGCLVGAPNFTRRVHREAAAWIFSLKRLKEFYFGLVILLTVASVLIGINIGVGEFPGVFDGFLYQNNAELAENWMTSFRVVGFIASVLAILVFAGLLLDMERSVTLKTLLASLVFLLLMLISSGIGAMILALFFTCMICGLAMLAMFVVPGCVVYFIMVTLRLAGSQETASIAAGTVFGIAVGGLLGWTGLEPLLTAAHMLIGAVSGTFFGWAYSHFGAWVSSTKYFEKTELFLRENVIPDF